MPPSRCKGVVSCADNIIVKYYTMVVSVPDAARVSFARVGKVRMTKEVEAEKLVPFPDNLRRMQLLCGPGVFLSLKYVIEVV